jgi:hypothetical protein
LSTVLSWKWGLRRHRRDDAAVLVQAVGPKKDPCHSIAEDYFGLVLPIWVGDGGLLLRIR